MQIPYVWQIVGQDPKGPNVCVFGGVHGDEKLGVFVVKRLLEHFGIDYAEEGGVFESEMVTCANLYLGIGNPVAVEQDTRAAGNGPDLNRSFSQSEINQEPCDEDRYDLLRARELMPLFFETDFLLDIHSTSSPSEPFVCMGNYTPKHGSLCALMPIRNILTDPFTVLSQDFGRTELGTTDYAVNVFGGSAWSERMYGKKRGVAFCYESGYALDLGKEDEVLCAAFRYLHAVGAVDSVSDKASTHMPQEQRVYRLTELVRALHDDFQFLDAMKQGWQRLSEGQVLGRYNSNGLPHVISAETMLLFPRGKSVFVQNEPLCYFAEEVL